MNLHAFIIMLYFVVLITAMQGVIYVVHFSLFILSYQQQLQA